MQPRLLYEKFDKTLLASLPPVVFDGTIRVILSQSEADRAVDFLLRQPRVGIDTETRPSFRRGSAHKVALLQVATPDQCFLFRLCALGQAGCVRALLEAPGLLKVGLSLKDDFLRLHDRIAFQVCNYVDLQEAVRPLGVKDMSLQKLYANFFGQKISKKQRLTNWEADVLTEAQKRYAATDAWACLRLYDELQALLQSRAYTLVPAPAPEPLP